MKLYLPSAKYPFKPNNLETPSITSPSLKSKGFPPGTTLPSSSNCVGLEKAPFDI